MTTMKSKKSHKKGKWWLYAKKTAKEIPSTHVKTHLEKETKAMPSPSKEQNTSPIHKKKNKRKRKSKSKTSGADIPENKSKSGENSRNAVSKEMPGENPRQNAATKREFNSEVFYKKASDTGGNQFRLSHKSGADIEQQNDSKRTKLLKKKRRKLKIQKRRENEKVASQNSLEHIQRNKESVVAKGTIDSHPGTVKTDFGDKRKLEAKAQSENFRGHSMDPNSPGGQVSHGDGSRRKRKRKQAKKQQQENSFKKRRKVDQETQDSGMSSGAETPNLPSKPQDVAANWKVLVSKLKESAPTKRKSKLKKICQKDDGGKKEGEIWFDDVDPALVEAEKISSDKKSQSNQNIEEGESTDASGVKSNQITKCIGMDCEMVGTGHQGKESILARVSMVNEYGQCIYDKFVRPREKVTDYRTAVSGVRPSNLYEAAEFLAVQKEVADLMKDRILVGHALRNDMKVLFLGHPRRLIRDTATYPPFRELMKTKRPALRKLAKSVLGVTIQEGAHSSVVDARTAMRLYTLHRAAWEKSLKLKGKAPKKDTKEASTG